MTKLEELAHHFAEGTKDCDPNHISLYEVAEDGFVAGFRAACELEGQKWDHVVTSEANNPAGPNEQLIAIAKRNAVRVRATYEEEAT